MTSPDFTDANSWRITDMRWSSRHPDFSVGELTFTARFGTRPPLSIQLGSPSNPEALGFGGLRFVLDSYAHVGDAELYLQLASGAFSQAGHQRLPSIFFEFPRPDTLVHSIGTDIHLCEVGDTSVVYELIRSQSDFELEKVQPILPREASKRLTSLLPHPHIGELLLSTGSEVKIAQYSFLFRAVGVMIRGSEIQHSPSEPQVEGSGDKQEEVLVREPLKHLARFAAKNKTHPLVLEDTMLFVEHFNSDFDTHPILPGPDTKRWWSALGSDGLLRLMEGSSQRRAVFVCQLGMRTVEGDYVVFRAERRGTIAHEIRQPPPGFDFFPYVIPHNFHNIFIPDGSEKTYSEMLPGEFRSFDYRADCVQHLIGYLLGDPSVRPSPQLRLF